MEPNRTLPTTLALGYPLRVCPAGYQSLTYWQGSIGDFFCDCFTIVRHLFVCLLYFPFAPSNILKENNIVLAVMLIHGGNDIFAGEIQ